MTAPQSPRPKVIAVTGASRGLGAATALELARRGHTVGALSRQGRGIEAGVPAELADRIHAIPCDVDDDGQVRAAFAELAAHCGRIDGLVNNAGRFHEVASADCTTEDFERVLRTNVTGTFVCCREIRPHLLAAGGGLIVNMGSFFEKIGARFTPAYGTSKAAVGAITRALAVEWVKDNIRVLDVAPGFIATDLNAGHREREQFMAFMRRRIPVGRPGEPAEVAQLIGLLFQEDMPYLTGETIHLDGAISIAQ